MHLASELLLLVTFGGTILLQTFGSGWMWIIIGTVSKQPLVPVQLPLETQSTLTTTQQPFSTLEQPSEILEGAGAAPLLTHAKPLGTSRKSRKKLGIFILLTPLLLYILAVALMEITSKASPGYYSSYQNEPLVIGKIADLTTGLSGALFAPCVVTGIVLIVRRK